MYAEEVREICARHGIEIRELRTVTGSFDKQIFFINDAYLLRVSEVSMAQEQEKFGRAAGLPFVPEIMYTGAFDRGAGFLYYTLLTLLPGDDLVRATPEMTLDEQVQLGRDVAAFLDRLHARRGASYDIGLYLPAIPDFTGTWRDGHEQYWAILKQGVEAVELAPDSQRIFEAAFQFMHSSIDVLDYQNGPRLLHNDFHPMNILANDGRFCGVIDWECSQYGEADFELCHLIHWCLYPPNKAGAPVDFQPFLRTFFEAAPECARVPALVERLTIYQIEHEIQQLIWHGRHVEDWRVPRIRDWMDGGVGALFRQMD